MDRDPSVEALQVHLKASRRLRAFRETETLLTALEAILDPDLRLHRFAEYLASRSPERAAWTIASLRARLAAGEERARHLCLGLLIRTRLEGMVAPDHLERIRIALERAGEPSASLFKREMSRRMAAEAADPEPKEPVGHRISLARKAVSRFIERFLFDPDTRVVRTILGNPRVTEADVVKLAASRRATPEALEAIAIDDRWIARYPVKVALANNPTTSLRVVLGLLPYLLRQDLESLATSSSNDEVRQQASSLLAHRPGG